MRLLLTLSLVAIAFAGCVDADVDDAGPGPLPLVDLHGRVLTPNFNPVEGANVTLTTPSTVFDDGSQTDDLVQRSTTTGPDGNFTIQTVPGNFPVHIRHDGFKDFQNTVTAPQDNVTFELEPINVDIPFNEEFTFDGTIECAMEAFIISPSCDALVQSGPGEDAVFEDQSVFDIVTPRGWQTIVLDVRYDHSQHTTIEGLRASAYTIGAQDELGEYERIHQEWAAGDFSLRIDAGADYGDNVPAPGSDGGDDMRFRFFPHGYADDTICTPEQTPGDVHPSLQPGTCFLGVGATQDLTFSATATLFVHEPAPEGWTTLGQA